MTGRVQRGENSSLLLNGQVAEPPLKVGPVCTARVSYTEVLLIVLFQLWPLTIVLDLEPATTAVVSRDSARSLGHVHGDGALVVDGRVEGEGDGVSSLDGHGLRVCARSADIASEIIRCQVCHDHQSLVKSTSERAPL